MISKQISVSPSHPKYRPDIDGLRGIAVLLVVGYHAFPSIFPGGFIGVDIFFVISGYLISTIILQNLSQNTFSFVDFYSRRVRRIFPALIVIFASCYTLGWFVLLPHEFKQLGKHLAGGSTFISNFILWNESGYFDNTAITKPLLHLWSLGIEEQFYIAWPLILWAAYKNKINILVITFSIILVSFTCNIWFVYQDLVAAFYSPITRVWELLFGALLAYKSISHTFKVENNSYISLLAIAILIIGVLIIDKNNHFPGAWALLPTLATTVLIAVGPNSYFNQTLLSNRVLVWFGLISFPLYLWHWPLLSFARIIEAEAVSANARIVIVMLSIFLAWITFTLIEKPFRYGLNGFAKVVVLTFTLMFIGYCGFNSFDRNGLEFRGPQIIGKDRGYDGGPGGTMIRSCGLPEDISIDFTCWQDTRPTIRYALVGDSKAEALHGGLVRTSTPEGRWLFIGSGSKATPLPIITSEPLYSKYQHGSVVAINSIAENKQIEVVLIASATRALFQLKNDTDIEDLDGSPNYQIALDGLQKVINVLKSANKKIVLLVDNPTLPHPEDCLPRITTSDFLNRVLKQTMNQRCVLSLDRHLELSRKYRQLLSTLVDNNKGVVTLFDPTPFLCNQTSRICTTSQNGRLLYGGTDHISDYAAGLIGIELNLYLQTLLIGK